MDVNLTIEQRLAELEQEMQRRRDREEIENLFGRYQWLHYLIFDEQIVDLYAQKTPGVRRHDVGHGILHGIEGIKKYHMNRPRYRGKMIVHALTNPIIEVAGDGKTAKGLWISAGHECCPYLETPDPAYDTVAMRLVGPDKYGIKKFVHWVWNKYAVDFVKEDGQWKIWHFYNCSLMRAPFDEDWIDFSITNLKDNMLVGLSQPLEYSSSPFSLQYDEPSPVHQDGYTITEPPSTDLMPPVPYYTFSETFSY